MSPPLSSGFHTPVHSLHFTLGAAAAFRELDLNGGREGEGLFFFFKGESLQTAYFIQPSPLTPSPGMNHALFLVPGAGGGLVHQPSLLSFSFPGSRGLLFSLRE